MSTQKMRYLVLCLLLTSGLFAQSTASSDELSHGVAAFKASKYEEAIKHFRNAVAYDDSNVKAHLYLATTLATMYVPGVESPDNKQFGDSAKFEYERVLELEPKNLDSLKALGYLSLQMKEFARAKEYYRKVTTMDPNDPEPHYSIGVIDWMQTYQPRMELLAKIGIKQGVSLIQYSECWTLRSGNEETIRDGIEALNMALRLRPDYDDAMAYMNLLYRERAEIECGNEQAHSADLKAADDWVDKTMAVKKVKGERQNTAR